MAGIPFRTKRSFDQVKIGEFFNKYDNVEDVKREIKVLENWHNLKLISDKDYNRILNCYNYVLEKLNK